VNEAVGAVPAIAWGIGRRDRTRLAADVAVSTRQQLEAAAGQADPGIS